MKSFQKYTELASLVVLDASMMKPMLLTTTGQCPNFHAGTDDPYKLCERCGCFTHAIPDSYAIIPPSIKAHTCSPFCIPIHCPGGLVRHGHQPSYWLGCSGSAQLSTQVRNHSPALLPCQSARRWNKVLACSLASIDWPVEGLPVLLAYMVYIVRSFF